ncbi:metalloprotease [Mycobacterium phage Refuge]|uniref:Metalloprotease n=1 Tax=Mycobacterium phage Refuge TaxID=2517967 RepID=A0A482JB18_9CAUD|nr:peptidase [Mycobacterium phage Refuge]QBP31027.1 metalloprotease [Mycobacterium phage Refuge]
MGGRGTGGGPGPGSGKSKAKRGAGSLSGSGGSAGGGGSSAGSSGSGGKGNSGAGTGGVSGGGGSAGGQAGGGSGTTVNQQQNRLSIEFGGDLTDAEKAREQRHLDELPAHLQHLLEQRDTRIFVGGRADESPGWANLGYKPTDKTADGRDLGDLSFYIPSRNEVYISARSPHGSVNVYVHELGHAIDYQWIGLKGREVEFPPGSGNFETVRIISEDPEFRSMHRKYILNNAQVRKYYRTGSQGTAQSGRRESVAEGMAEYTKYGRDGLVSLFHSAAAADAWIAIMKRYGVIK